MQPPLGPLELLRNLRQRRIQAGLLVVREVRRDGIAPLRPRTPDQAAVRVALAAATLLDAVHLLVVRPREIPAGEAGERPADRLLRSAEMQQMLLGLVGVVPDRIAQQLRAGRRGGVGRGLDANEPLQGVQTSARLPPLVRAGPWQPGLQVLGRAPAVRVAEPGENGACAADAERVDQLAPQQPECHRVEQQDALAGEPQDAAFRVDLQQFLQVQISCTHRPPAPVEMRGKAITLIVARGREDGRIAENKALTALAAALLYRGVCAMWAQTRRET